MGNHVMMLNLRKSKYVPGSVIVITGASSGMGKELTYRYAERGAKIVITSRSIDKLQAIADECNERFPYSKVLSIKTNVQVEEECKRLIEFTIEKVISICRLQGGRDLFRRRRCLLLSYVKYLPGNSDFAADGVLISLIRAIPIDVNHTVFDRSFKAFT